MNKLILIGAVMVVGFFVLIGCNKEEKPYDTAEIYNKLRTTMLNSITQNIGLEMAEGSPGVFGLIMETGHPETIVSLFAITGGNVSIYISNGGAILGTGNFPVVSTVADELIAMTSNYMSSLVKTTSYPLPRRGFVRFYILADNAVFNIEVREKTLINGNHSLSQLFYKCHELLTKVIEFKESQSIEQTVSDTLDGLP